MKTEKKTRAPDRPTGVKETDRLNISKMYSKGQGPTAISKALGISIFTVKQDITIIRKEWLRRSLTNFNELKAEQLAKIDRIEEEAWRLLDKSEKPLQSKTAKIATSEGGKKKAPGKGYSTHTVNHEERVGDPRFLQIINQCVEQRCKMLGLFAATKIDNTGSAGTQDNPIHVEHSSKGIELALEKIYGGTVPAITK